MATRWGICSVGTISHDFAVALKTLPPEDHQIASVAARDLGRAQEFAKLFDIPTAYGSYEDLVKDPNIDVVYIGSIHPEHKRLCMLALNHGKPVLCEKPFMLNSKQAKEVIDFAKEKKLFLMEAIWSRFLPGYEQIRKEIAEQNIGEVRFVQASFGQTISHLERITNKSLGGGALLDMGIYPIQLASMVFGERPTKIVATGHLFPTGVDEVCTITLHYSNGRMAQLAAHTSVLFQNSAVIYGTKGKLELPEKFWCPTKLITPAKTYSFPMPETTYKTNCVNSTGLCYQARAVRECLKKGELESAVVSHHESLLLMEIMDECRKQMGVVYDIE
ncbi:trans-1,2-dihydrobenzene-1,2-diol dehydrogenase-like isoform X2 [Lingula anatina]|uniref:Trans-1,2-dihydrobenzene-1,2-diol dehydrogenase n=1 Tax=Lingula anatina TaxID=7574 RepID=A0A1S3KDT8_LINAN|nr:trans-1,2-dihydrobenzene-1,2-diol dehydrogenase-like isoform X1 [Lingula anatina]XP_013420788.1 trans-1,2-dihydrobenzene-1,2-diol dehydrogenase-like isoform X1 [Lingula anatina]XP_013420790.1 trans-1,2-dihydrobenzene-1,2-diol dehydrogenase-like isoform X2 [Lingula anatina]XP_013420791.1 trans-1,2-dihydrobenzene-1,2-diol dehydrogenase-like isoform X2 [Lingula anatina]|eukprot:XP_013420787.1 trans-1,2-dihydrobenzene-1,2-diol dehydrogenase-like isoform X1 [Lingula anatina]